MIDAMVSIYIALDLRYLRLPEVERKHNVYVLDQAIIRTEHRNFQKIIFSYK